MPVTDKNESLDELRIQLLGNFSITIGSRKISSSQFKLRKSRNLVKLLALAPDHRMHRDQLAELLWPHQDPKTAVNNLYHSLFMARKVLDPESVHSHNYLQIYEENISLCPDSPFRIDAEDFSIAAKRAFRTHDQEAYTSALALYHGDLLPEDRYEDWCHEARVTLCEEHLRLLVDLARLLENLNDYSGGIEKLKEALTVDPLNEETHAGLMRLYSRNGQRQLALRQYQLLEETMKREVEARPDPAITHLYKEIFSGHFPYAKTSSEPLLMAPENMQASVNPLFPLHNLPLPMTSFIGREPEMKEIKRLLLPQLNEKGQTQERQGGNLLPVRLVNLTGGGGCGKTRLALETARGLLEYYRDGVWLVELAGLTDPDFLPQTLISILHIHNVPGQSLLSTLANYLKQRQILLVLDNCEHLVEACVHLAETLLKNCLHLQILATSQEILGLPGEVSFPITPLTLPDQSQPGSCASTVQSEAVHLFVERARNVRPGFVFDDNNCPSVVKICQRVDGIPLAIELAASRVKVMQVEEIAERLEHSFDLLTGGSRTALLRYQSLYGSIDWSYRLLSEREASFFRRLAVFAGGWSLEAAVFVAASSDPAQVTPQRTDEVLELLTQLVNKSLVIPHQIQGAPTRYHFLDTIRRFALDRLRESLEEKIIRNRHLDYYEQFACQVGPQLRGPDQVGLISKLEAEHDNLRSALEWSLGNPVVPNNSSEEPKIFPAKSKIDQGLSLATALFWFWNFLFNRTEGTVWLERLLEGEELDLHSQPIDTWSALLRGRALYAAGWFEVGVQKQKYVEESLVIYRRLGQDGRQGAANALSALAGWSLTRGEYELALAQAKESLALFREIGDSFGQSELLSGAFTSLAMVREDFSQARMYNKEALTIVQDLGDRDGIALAYLRLGEIASREGNYRQAWTLLENALDIYHRLGNKLGHYFVLLQMGETALAQGDPEQAEAIFSELLVITREVGARLQTAASLTSVARALFDQGKYELASQRFLEAVEIGREINDHPTVVRALRGLGEVKWSTGDFISALQFLTQALEVKGEPANQKEIFLTLESLAGLAVDLGYFLKAVNLFAATQDMYDSMHYSLSPRHCSIHSEKLGSLQVLLGEMAFNEAWFHGQGIGLDETIQLALSLNNSDAG